MIKSQLRKTANITATAKSWDEARYDSPDGQAALAQADFALTYSGDLVGESSTRMLIAYTEGDPAEPASLVGEYVGLERVTGSLDGRTGSFVVELRGRHEDYVAKTTGQIVPGSGSGEFEGLHGEVEYAAGDMTFDVTLSYAFEPGTEVH
jgi:hypothetical protein